MDDAALARELKRVGNLGGNAESVGQRHRPSSEALAKRLALDELHGDERNPGAAIALADLVDLGDEGMIEPGRGVGLAQETPPGSLIRHLAFGQELERDLPVEPKVLGQVDLAHSPLADLGENPVVRNLAADHRASRIGVRTHRTRPARAMARASARAACRRLTPGTS